MSEIELKSSHYEMHLLALDCQPAKLYVGRSLGALIVICSLTDLLDIGRHESERDTNESVSTESGSGVQNSDLTRPNSAGSSQPCQTPSIQSSTNSLSVEERLKRIREADKLKQQQRYCAYIETQRQAEMARLRHQEDRRRKIEEMRLKEQTRRLNASERRAALEMSNRARLERIRQRSVNRSGTNLLPRQNTAQDYPSRTTSNSPLGSARNPGCLMTTSCVVAFGSSAPRSILISNRSNSSSECDRVGRPNQRRKFTTIDGTERVTDAKNRENKAKVKNAAPSSSHSAVSARSSSAEGNSRQTKRQTKPHSSDCTLNSKKISQNNRETKRNGNFAVPSVMAKSVSKTLPSRRCSPPPSCPSNIQESGTATASFPTVPQSLSLSESEIKAFTTEGFSDAIVSSDKSAPPDSSKVVDVKDDLLAFASQVGPIKAETHGSGDGVVLSEMEAAVYRAKLIEQRRLAKERRQKEEEEEKRRVEEENRLRSMQQEQARLAAEEELRLKEEQAIRQAEETQRKKEAEEIARLEAEKAERLAKLQRDEEERSLRRKKLYTIMSRVKRSSSPEKTNDVQDCEIDKINQRVCSDINAHHNDTDIPIFDSTQDDSSIVRTVVNKKLCNNVEKTGESSSTDINHEEELEVDNATLTVASGQNETLARNLITMPSLDPDSSVTQNTPVFKSALLQSMLAKGRLSTHVKEAVAGLRRNASQTQVNSSEDDSPLHYPLMNAANEDIDSVIMKHESSKTTSENCGLPHFNGSK
ncbi:unnamed protein product [Heterobilharzia americana]|nr:unnamed protein product [Heterobilharzia americana]